MISQYGKIIRMDSSTIRESGRAARGVRLLHLEPVDRVAAEPPPSFSTMWLCEIVGRSFGRCPAFGSLHLKDAASAS